MRINQLTESNEVLYHGDDYGTTALTPQWMMHGERFTNKRSNNQEGVGIYFTPEIEVAKTYGSKISQISTEGLKVVNSRMSVKNAVKKSDALKLLNYLNENNENFWYLITDYNIEITGPEDVEPYHLQMLFNAMKDQEIRNWQIELADASSVIDLVTGWNKFIPIDGLYESVSKFYSIINTNVKVTPVNF
jgi:hypothetical protein